MRSPFAKLRWVAVVAALSIASGWAGVRSVVAAQYQQLPPPSAGPGSPPPFGDASDANSNDPAVRLRAEKMEKARNTQRQEQLERDTDKLFDLAKELKDQVDKSNKDTLSIDVVKKAAEIEKLAKSVKDRMRG